MESVTPRGFAIPRRTLIGIAAPLPLLAIGIWLLAAHARQSDSKRQPEGPAPTGLGAIVERAALPRTFTFASMRWEAETTSRPSPETLRPIGRSVFGSDLYSLKNQDWPYSRLYLRGLTPSSRNVFVKYKPAGG
jgi:hypothetical protein